MRSVGEVMGIGGTFQEAMLKAIASLEGGWPDVSELSEEAIREILSSPTPDRLAAIVECMRRGWSSAQIHEQTRVDTWFLDQMEEVVVFERALNEMSLEDVSEKLMFKAKQMGMTDSHLAKFLSCSPQALANHRKALSVLPVYKRVDTCAAEFESHTPYLYSTYADECEAGESESDRVIILGNGPNRIGQGLEFDYCCCHAAFAVQDEGLTAVMVNNNPETVSTDYDTSDKLYFEPIDLEHVQSILDREKPRGVILQFGGQTPLKLSHHIAPVLGTPADAIDLCEDRKRFNVFLEELDILQPRGETATSIEEARETVKGIGFPCLVRPSYVLGGRSMVICYDDSDFERAVHEAMMTSEARSLLIDRYLVGAVEYDVDALCDGRDVFIGGIIEHIEPAGVHSGDSAGVLPPVQLSPAHLKVIEDQTTRIAKALGVIGLVNIQYAIADDKVYVLEVNPRASRTVPFVSKAIGLPLARMATQLCLGRTLKELGPLRKRGMGMYFIKAPVFPWQKFPGSDVVLGPEMRSTGEVMGVGWGFGEAYAKALIAAGLKLPTEGSVFLSLQDRDKEAAIGIAGSLAHMGFELFATGGTARYLAEHGIACQTVFKVREGRPNVVDHLKNGKIQLMLNTPLGKKAQYDEVAMRLAGLRYGVPCLTTISAARAVVSAIRSLRAGEMRVIKLQEIQ
jgi:carbamoyl-phosphate synthase large subunit